MSQHSNSQNDSSTPDSEPESEAPYQGTVGDAMRHGALGFGVASMVVFSLWAFTGRWTYRSLGELGAYAWWAVVFMGLAGGFLQRSLVRNRGFGWFNGVFGSAFFLYAAAWTGCWMGFSSRRGGWLWKLTEAWGIERWAAQFRLSEWLGALVGTVLMGLVFSAAFRSWRNSGKIIASLFALNCVGYFLGDFLYTTVGGTAGKLLWGVAYGLGFGAGIGMALHYAQRVEGAAVGNG